MAALKCFTALLLILSLADAERVAREHPAGYCMPSQCKNNATCVSTQGFFECVCPKGYVGDYCQYTECINDFGCWKRGTCTNGHCLCTSDYNGDVCEYKIYKKTWDVDTEDDFKIKGKLGLHMGGANKTIHHGRIFSNENFTISLESVNTRFFSQEYCVRFMYNIPAGSGSKLEVYQVRTPLVPNMPRMELADSYFIKDGQWREARVNAHGWVIDTDLVISGRTDANTAYLALDQIWVQRSRCEDITFQ